MEVVFELPPNAKRIYPLRKANQLRCWNKFVITLYWTTMLLAGNNI